MTVATLDDLPTPLAEKVADWRPQNSLTWAAAALCLVLFANVLWTGAAHAYMMVTTDNSPLVEVFDYRPEHVFASRGEPISFEYLYTKRACYGQVSYTMRQMGDPDESLNNWTMGPYAAAWPATKEPRWITQTIPDRYSNLQPGEYKLFWQASTTCEGVKGEKPTSKTVYTKSPVTYITILGPGQEKPDEASWVLPQGKSK